MRSSIVGSIGVVGGSFGFDKLIEKLGIERRLYTSGERKAMLDPFLPEKPEDVKRLKAIQREIHENFIALVKERRGAQAQRPRKRPCSPANTGPATRPSSSASSMPIGDLRTVLRERYGDKVRTPLIARAQLVRPHARRASMRRRAACSARPSLADDMVSALEARALWSRYGL